jgi:hypothetical protein
LVDLGGCFEAEKTAFLMHQHEHQNVTQEIQRLEVPLMN